MHRILAAIALIGTLMAVVPARGAPSLAAMELRLADLPAGFVVSHDHDLTLAQLAAGDHRSPAAEARTGAVRGHETDFTRKATTGLVEIDSEIVAYASQATLRAAFAAFLAKKPPAGFRPLAVHGLGAAAAAYRVAIPTATLAGTLYAFVFRRGIYSGAVFVLGEAHTTTLAQALAYPKIVDAHIKAAMGRVPDAPAR